MHSMVYGIDYRVCAKVYHLLCDNKSICLFESIPLTVMWLKKMKIVNIMLTSNGGLCEW